MADIIKGHIANAVTLEATKVTTAKSAAAAIVTAMATDVTNGNFAAARLKAQQLEKAYGELSNRILP
jgi:hypothetical protein